MVRTINALTFFFIIAEVMLFSLLIVIGLGSGKTITVDDDDGGADFNNIQDAINASEEGDTIRVWEGVYYENVVVNKTVSLVGNGSQVSTIDGVGNGDVVEVTADWANINGFSINGSGWNDSGIKIESNNNTIQNNNCTNNYYGIFLTNTSNNKLQSNTCSSNKYDIRFISSSNNTLDSNTCSSNRSNYGFNYAIFLWDSSNNKLWNNSCSENYYGIFLWNSSNNILDGNTCSSIRFNYGIFLSNSSYNELQNNTCSSNNNGIILQMSNNNTLDSNTCENNSLGIYLYDSSNNTIMNNSCNNNNHDGIYLESSQDNTISHNNVSNNSGPSLGTGISITDKSHNNKVLYNVLISNEISGISVRSSDKSIIKFNSCSKNKNGIEIVGSYQIIIDTNSLVSNTETGIIIESSNDNEIINNECHLNGNHGISLIGNDDNPSGSGNNILDNNSLIENKWSGIELKDTNNNVLSNNTMVGCGIFFNQGPIEHWISHSIDQTNSVNGKPIFYLKNSTGQTISDKFGQVIIANCTNLKIQNQSLSKCSIGITVGYSGNITISSSTISDTHGGIVLGGSDNISIFSNILFNCLGGLVFVDCHNNSIEDNLITNNSYFGLGFLFSSNNEIMENTIRDNRNGLIFFNNTMHLSDLPITSSINPENIEYYGKNRAHFNSISGNSEYGIAYDHYDSDEYPFSFGGENNDDKLDATKNWWGHDSGPLHYDSGQHGKGDKISGNVDYSPWLDSDGNLRYPEDPSSDRFLFFILLLILVLLLLGLYLVGRLP